MKGSASAPSSATMNGTRWAISPAMQAISAQRHPTTSTTARSLRFSPAHRSKSPYKLGDKYYGARSNEFGYANYEIIPEVKEVNPLGPGKIELR